MAFSVDQVLDLLGSQKLMDSCFLMSQTQIVVEEEDVVEEDVVEEDIMEEEDVVEEHVKDRAEVEVEPEDMEEVFKVLVRFHGRQ